MVFALLASVDFAGAADSEGEKPRLSVRGLGLIENRQMRAVVLRIHPDYEKRGHFDANFIEDTFLIVRNRLVNQGHLDASVTATLELTNASTLTLEWDGREELRVPRPLTAHRLRLKVREGPLYYFDQLEFDGLTSLTPAEAEGFFFKTDMLLRLRSTRRYSPATFRSSLANLRTELVHRGYREARVTAESVELDPGSGGVRVRVKVEEGLLHEVASAVVNIRADTNSPVLHTENREPGVRQSPFWEQDFLNELRVRQFREGHPDATAHLRELEQTTTNAVVRSALEATVVQGPAVELGDVRFEGQERTRLSLLQHKAELTGPLLDRMEVDAARESLSRLGVFDYVGVRYEPESGLRRDVVFELDEGKRIDFSVLAGYGSYDQLFGGIELNQFNLFGIGHNHRLRAMQSFKTSNVIYTYSVPEFFARDLSLFGNVDLLRREEVSFIREELKTALGVRRSPAGTGAQYGARYSYEFLRAEDSPAMTVTNGNFTRVAAIVIEGQLDRRDNPLSPRRGWRLFAEVEFADPALGGEAAYQLVEAGASLHQPLTRGLILHAGVEHGVAFAENSALDLPFNKRFFPGGENSVRGYQRGEASPLDAEGNEIGAETYLQWNVELEQYLTERWSIVAFVDGVGMAARFASYPFDEVLWSVGGGLRWNSVVGPVRLEYGYNLNPREFDPEGTLHLSVGFPF